MNITRITRENASAFLPFIARNTATSDNEKNIIPLGVIDDKVQPGCSKPSRTMKMYYSG
ncbi:MAG: hypothetical protein K6E34_11470 [Lachnospiraceae bacterium]|nr:hypothetical protein [Lachnospiraceae bacterium]